LSLLAVGLAVLLVALAPLASPGVPTLGASERVVRIQASRFAYEPAVVRVNRGDRVTLELVSTDVVHGLYVDGYGVSAEADPGQPARISFVADRPGTFRFRCSVLCGGLHPFMIGKLEVGSGARFWVAMAIGIPAALAGLLGWRP